MEALKRFWVTFCLLFGAVVLLREGAACALLAEQAGSMGEQAKDVATAIICILSVATLGLMAWQTAPPKTDG